MTDPIPSAQSSDLDPIAAPQTSYKPSDVQPSSISTESASTPTDLDTTLSGTSSAPALAPARDNLDEPSPIPPPASAASHSLQKIEFLLNQTVVMAEQQEVIRQRHIELAAQAEKLRQEALELAMDLMRRRKELLEREEQKSMPEPIPASGAPDS